MSVALAAVVLAVAQLTADDARRAVREVAPEVEAIRGLRFRKPVPVSTIGDDEATRYASSRFERFSPPAELYHLQEAYARLGLLPEGADVRALYLDVLREQAGGYYDPSKKAFYLLDDMPAALASALAAHELTHALEDQHYDLDRRIEEVKDDDDRAFARSAVHEGSASVVMLLHMARRISEGRGDGKALEVLARSEAGKAERLDAFPAALRRQLLGAYVLGTSFWLRGDSSRLAAGFPVADAPRVMRDGPTSSEQLLHPEKYWVDARRDEPVRVSLGRAGAALGRGYRRVASGVLGELTLGVLVGAPTPAGNAASAVFAPEAWTNGAASGWGGDRWELWRRGEVAVVLLATAWDTETDAREFADALPARPDLAWERAGRVVAIVAGEDGDRRAAALRAIVGSASAAATRASKRDPSSVEP